MKLMDFIFADFLSPDQLMEDDYIKNDGLIYKVKSVSSVADGYVVEAINDFDESEEFFFPDDAKIEWYVFADE